MSTVRFNKNRRYEYDALGRLTKAFGGAATGLGQGASSWSQIYQYDRFGNRTNVTESGQTGGVGIPKDGIGAVSYNQYNNRITNQNFEYDAAGNLTKGLAPDGLTVYRYEYDAANRLIAIKNDNGGAIVQTQEFGIGNSRLSVTDYSSNQISQRTYYYGKAVEYTETASNGVLSGILVWSKSYVYLGDSLLSTATPNGRGEKTLESRTPMLWERD